MPPLAVWKRQEAKGISNEKDGDDVRRINIKRKSGNKNGRGKEKTKQNIIYLKHYIAIPALVTLSRKNTLILDSLLPILS